MNVQSVQQISVNGVPYAQVHTNSIADYYTTMTANMIQELNSRPRAATDFRQGHTTATVGQVVRFGDDIGYNSAGCNLGYWPPGPGCPTAQNRTFNFPMQPLRATQTISTTLGAIGLWVDGTAVYNWSDAQSYMNGHVWWNAAMAFEVYDMDICPGHAAMGDYHHHSYSDCMAQLVGDTGAGHSPVYGFAADGYPIYGPWEAAGVLAQSGWRTRDYDDPASPTGCGMAHVRNCLLRNPLDPSQGTVPSGQTGPRTDSHRDDPVGQRDLGHVGHLFPGLLVRYSCTTCLDPHNGHDEHDGRGYHYHVTAQAGPWGHLVAVFPYVLGPTYAGQLQPSATYTPSPPGPPPPRRTRRFPRIPRFRRRGPPRRRRRTPRRSPHLPRPRPRTRTPWTNPGVRTARSPPWRRSQQQGRGSCGHCVALTAGVETRSVEAQHDDNSGGGRISPCTVRYPRIGGLGRSVDHRADAAGGRPLRCGCGALVQLLTFGGFFARIPSRDPGVGAAVRRGGSDDVTRSHRRRVPGLPDCMWLRVCRPLVIGTWSNVTVRRHHLGHVDAVLGSAWRSWWSSSPSGSSRR